jgi:virginiamycin B lyase
MRTISILLAAVAAIAAASPAGAQKVVEIPLHWPAPEPAMRPHHAPAGDGMGMSHDGSTHEIAFVPGRVEAVISGQNYDSLARVGANGRVTYQRMKAGSGPHGLGFDKDGLLWVTLEFAGRVIAFAPDGRKVKDIPVTLDCDSCALPINTHPHGLGVAADGRTVWFTGKATGTVGRIAADGSLATWQLPTIGSLPIYIRPGPDPAGTARETMWVTELTGNRIASISVEPGKPFPKAEIREYAIPTANSRPIAVERGPDGRMWFSEEAGGKVARIEADGSITEFVVPKPAGHPNMLLAALAFDSEGNLWVQQYVDHANPKPAGRDRIVRISRRILGAKPGTLKPADFAYFAVPTADRVMHRIAQGPDGAMWFTELEADRVGRVVR